MTQWSGTLLDCPDVFPHPTLHMNSRITSFSWIPRPLKCFLTALARPSLLCRRFCCLRTIVGEYLPILPGSDMTV